MSDRSVPTAPTRAETMKLRECSTLQQALQTTELRELVNASVPKHLTGDRLLRVFTQAASKQPLLFECEMRGVIGQMLTCSALGLEINTPLGHAYLIPFKGRKKVGNAWVDAYDAQLVIGYKGLVDLAYRSGQVVSVDADIVMQGDDWEYEKGTQARLRYRQKVSKADGNPTFGFAIAHTARGGAPFEVMLWEDIMAIRNGSNGYRAALAAKERAQSEGKPPPKSWTEAPWVKHQIPMACKTVFNQLAKWLSLSPEVSSAIALDAAGDIGSGRFAGVIDSFGDPSSASSDRIIDAAVESVEGEDDANTVYTDRRPPADPPKAAPAPTPRATQTAHAAPGIHTATAPASPASPAPTTAATGAAARDDVPTDRWGDSEPHPNPEAPTTPTPAASEWYYLTDENGEVVEGPDAATQDPVIFAERFIARWRAANADVQIGLREQNADVIADARAASREAVDILSEMEMVPEPAPAFLAPSSRAIVAVPVPTNDTGIPNLAFYLEAIRTSLHDLDHGDRLLEWIAINQPYYANMPKGTKGAIQTLIDQARGWLAPDNAETNEALGYLTNIWNTRSVAALEALKDDSAMTAAWNRWKDSRPDLRRRLMATRDQQLARLKKVNTPMPKGAGFSDKAMRQSAGLASDRQFLPESLPA